MFRKVLLALILPFFARLAHAGEDDCEKSVLGMESLYQGEGADRFIRVGSEGGGHAPTDFEFDLLGQRKMTTQTMQATGWRPAAVRVVDFGPGSGLKAVAIVKDLIGDGILVSSLVGVDISEAMLGISAAEWRRQLPGTPAQTVQANFLGLNSVELPLTSQGTANLFLLVGQTLGNFENPAEVLGGIVSKMNEDDRIWIGLSLFGSEEDLRATAETAYTGSVVDEFTLKPLEAMGIARDDGTYEIVADPSIPAITGVFILNREVTTADGRVLPAGHEIQTFFSRRFVQNHVHVIAASAGLIIEMQYLDPTSGQILLWARKRRVGDNPYFMGYKIYIEP